MRRGDRGMGTRLGWAALAAALLLTGPAVAAEPATPKEKPKLTWGWWWDKKLHYHLEVPLEKIWSLPETDPITGEPAREAHRARRHDRRPHPGRHRRLP